MTISNVAITTVTTSATVNFQGNVYSFTHPEQALQLVNHINYMQSQVTNLTKQIAAETATLSNICTPANKIA